MKLFTKYNRINVLSTIIIFLLGCVAFSALLRYVIISQIDEDLRIEKNEIATYVNQHNHLPAIIEVRDQYTTYKAIDKLQLTANKIYTHSAYDKEEHQKELRRTIEFEIQANNSLYLVTVSKSLEGTDNLIQTIIAITIILILLILIATFFINRIVLRRLWQPFYQTLQTMKQFKLSNAQSLHFSETTTDEFNHLNLILNDALTKARQDYETLKEFTENASHELQTPLAVIQSKLDLLIQNENLSETESNTIQSAYDAVQNLNKLNQSLLLLAKIENKQFDEQISINLKVLLQNKINQFNELWKAGNISSDINLSDTIITGNIYLIEILLNNLLSNATKHNIENGSISIALNNKLEITNTGISKPLEKQKLYQRFSSQDKEAGNHGLGLSIIQQICAVSGFKCAYLFHAPNKHSFAICW